VTAGAAASGSRARVRPVAGPGVHPVAVPAQQTGRVVVPRHPDRDEAVSGEVSDGEHDVSESTA